VASSFGLSHQNFVYFSFLSHADIQILIGKKKSIKIIHTIAADRKKNSLGGVVLETDIILFELQVK
jgi:hypothetical protein